MYKTDRTEGTSYRLVIHRLRSFWGKEEGKSEGFSSLGAGSWRSRLVMWESSGVLEMASLGLTWLPFATEENEDQRGGGTSWLGTGGQLMTELELEPRPPVPTHCSSCFNRERKRRPSSSCCGSPGSWGKVAPSFLGSPQLLLAATSRGEIILNWSLRDRPELGQASPPHRLPQGLVIPERFRSRAGLPPQDGRGGPWRVRSRRAGCSLFCHSSSPCH